MITALFAVKNIDNYKSPHFLINQIFIMATKNTEAFHSEAQELHYYPGISYQRLFNAINEAGPTPTISQMTDIIHIVKVDFIDKVEKEIGLARIAKDDLIIKILYKMLDQQKGSIEMLQKTIEALKEMKS